MNTIKQKALHVWFGAMAFSALLATGIARAQAPDEGDADHPVGGRESELDREVRYATGLMDLGLPDFAAAVMNDVERKFPDAKAAAARLRIDAFASKGNFKQAEEELAKIPSNTVEYSSGRLLVSDRYYQFNKLKEAREGYESVLGAYGKSGPPQELRRFYMEAAYKFSQMLLNRSDPRGSVKALRYILTAKPDNYTKRSVSTEMAERLLQVAEPLPAGEDRKALLKEAADLCNDVMWEQDILFGRAVVVLAHSKKLNENVAAARKLVADQLPSLMNMEREIKESVREGLKKSNPRATPEDLARETQEALRESPMAQCKYLIGTLHAEDGVSLLAAGKEKEAKAQFGAALSQFFTVVRNYPQNSWAPEACMQIDKVMAVVKERNWPFDMPENVNMDAVLASRYKEANSRLADNNYTEAIKFYLQALNAAPGYPKAPSAVGALAQCYLHENNDLYARAVIGYLVERYNKNSERMNDAGNALLGVAQTYQEEGQGPRAREIYVLFTDRFTNHDQAPAILNFLGDAALRVTNYVDAVPMYQKVVDKYNRPGKLYYDALNHLAMCQVGLNDYSNAVATLRTYFGLLPDNSEKISVLLRIADATRKQEKWEEAATIYGTVVNSLAKPGNPYAPSAADRERNLKSREAAIFYRGYCYTRMKATPEQTAEFQAKAIESFESFLKEYPDSELAPQVLSNVGTLYVLQNQTDKANQVFDTLDKKYPGKISGILYVQFLSLIDLGRTEKAVEVAAKMVEEGAKKYTPSQFLSVGNKLLEVKQPAAALKAFELARVGADPVKERALWEQASIGLGKALVGANRAVDAAVPVSELLKRYARGPYTAEANEVLSQSYLAQAMAAPVSANRTNLFKQAMGARANYRQYLKEQGAIAESDMKLAEIQREMGEKKKMLGTYQRIFDLKPVDPRTIACIEESFMNMMPMLLEARRFDVALESIDYYIKTFSKGKHLIDARMWRSSQIPSDLVASADAAAAAAGLTAAPAAPSADTNKEQAATADTPTPPDAPTPATPVAPAPAAKPATP